MAILLILQRAILSAGKWLFGKFKKFGGTMSAESNNIIPMTDLVQATKVRVHEIRSSGIMRRRLQDLGILPGAEIEFVRAAPLNDPIELRVGQAFISLRRIEAERIDVECLP